MSLQNNILIGNKTTNVVRKTIESIENVLSCTLGPNGRSILIEGQMLDHTTTKDGYTIISKLAFEGHLERAILNYIQKISSILNRTVGDGTTTSVLVAIELFKSLSSNSSDINLTDFLRALKEVSIELENEIKNFVRHPKNEKELEELIKNVALVSSNYDGEITNLICKTYKEIGTNANITTKVSNNKESHVVISSGFEHLRGMVLPIFANENEGKDFFAAGNVSVILSEKAINASYMQKFSEIINKICIVKKGSLIIMAPSFDEVFLQFLYSNKQQFKENLNISS